MSLVEIGDVYDIDGYVCIATGVDKDDINVNFLRNYDGNIEETIYNQNYVYGYCRCISHYNTIEEARNSLEFLDYEAWKENHTDDEDEEFDLSAIDL